MIPAAEDECMDASLNPLPDSLPLVQWYPGGGRGSKFAALEPAQTTWLRVAKNI